LPTSLLGGLKQSRLPAFPPLGKFFFLSIITNDKYLSHSNCITLSIFVKFSEISIMPSNSPHWC
jgi:hypothetical protein